MTPKLEQELLREMTFLSPLHRAIFMKGFNTLKVKVWPLIEFIEAGTKRERNGAMDYNGDKIRKLLQRLGL